MGDEQRDVRLITVDAQLTLVFKLNVGTTGSKSAFILIIGVTTVSETAECFK